MLRTTPAGRVTPNFRPQRSVVDRMADDMIETNAYGGAFREAMMAKGWSALDLDVYGARARRRANERFNRKDDADIDEARAAEAEPYQRAVDGAQDDLAREAVEGTNRTLLVAVPVSDLCQLWQGLRDGAACSTVEATLRLEQVFEGARG